MRKTQLGVIKRDSSGTWVGYTKRLYDLGDTGHSSEGWVGGKDTRAGDG